MLGSEMESHEIESAFISSFHSHNKTEKDANEERFFFKHIFLGLFADRWRKIYQNVNNRAIDECQT